MISKLSNQIRVLASQTELQAITKEFGLKSEDIPKTIEKALQIFKTYGDTRTAGLKTNLLIGAVAFFIGNSLVPILVGS